MYTCAGTYFNKPWVKTDETGEEVTMQVLEVMLASVKIEEESIMMFSMQGSRLLNYEAPLFFMNVMFKCSANEFCFYIFISYVTFCFYPN